MWCPTALPQRRTLEGGSYSLVKLRTAFHTLRYNCCPRYCLSHIADLMFHIPWLSKDTNIAVQDCGYTCTKMRVPGKK